MKIALIVTLALLGVAAARPSDDNKATKLPNKTLTEMMMLRPAPGVKTEQIFAEDRMGGKGKGGKGKGGDHHGGGYPLLPFTFSAHAQFNPYLPMAYPVSSGYGQQQGGYGGGYGQQQSGYTQQGYGGGGWSSGY